MRITAQRLAVLRAVSGRPHCMADDVAEDVRAEIGAISRQAVYDALGILAEKGLIRRIQPAGTCSHGELITFASHSIVDNFPPLWARPSVKEFFAHTGGGGNQCRQTRSAGTFPRYIHSDIPTQCTACAACLHRLSTALCTARLDVHSQRHETVEAVLPEPSFCQTPSVERI